MPRGVPKKRCMAEFKKHAVETMREEKLSYSKPILFDLFFGKFCICHKHHHEYSSYGFKQSVLAKIRQPRKPCISAAFGAVCFCFHSITGAAS